jgi:glycosyltransferase involved in cell wall biosynthesis
LTGRLVLIGPHAREPVQWAALERTCELLGLEGVAIAPPLEETTNERHRQTAQISTPPPGSRFAELRLLPTGGRLRRAWRLVRQLRALRSDVVVLTAEPHESVVLDALAALSVLRRPAVVAIAAENRVTLPGGFRGRAIVLLWKRIDLLASAATATSTSFRAAGLSRRTETASLGLPVEAPPGGDARPRGGALGVAYVGRLVPEKGVTDLVDAVAAVDGVELILAGPGPLENELRDRAARPPLAGKLTILGLADRSTVWQVLRDADVLALLSRTERGWSEQFGFVLAEAMAVGTPVLGSDSGAIPEIVDGAGLVVPERSPAAVSVARERLPDHPALRARLAANARARYEAEYSIESYAKKLARLVAQTLAS